jgi:hypothetical protein
VDKAADPTYVSTRASKDYARLSLSGAQSRGENKIGKSFQI